MNDVDANWYNSERSTRINQISSSEESKISVASVLLANMLLAFEVLVFECCCEEPDKKPDEFVLFVLGKVSDS